MQTRYDKLLFIQIDIKMSALPSLIDRTEQIKLL